MLGVSEAAKEGGQSFDDYAEALRECDGAAESMAKTMQDNLTGDITILKSALEGLGIATEGVFDESFRKAVQGATDAVSQLEHEITHGELGVSLASLGDSLADLTETLVEAAVDALPGFIDGLKWIADNIEFIGAGVQTVVAAFIAYKTATVAAKIATIDFTEALAKNPFTAAAVAITAVVTALYSFSSAAEDAIHKETENTKEVNNFISAQKNLSDSLKDSAQSRAEEISAIDAQLQASKKLIDELFSETTSQERKAMIISQLSELYPKLNIAMNEYGQVVGATKEQLESYVETTSEIIRFEAAREHLAEVAKEQFAAEMALAEANEKVREQSKQTLAVQIAAEAEAKKHVDISGEQVEVYNEYDAALEQAEASLDRLKRQQEEDAKTAAELGDEYQRTLDYINNNAPIDEATESLEAMENAEEEVKRTTEELEQEYTELEEAIKGSISTSLDLTNKWSQEWSTSTKQMAENVDSQIEGIENWAKNFDKLASQSKVAIDDRVMKYLADLGTEGAGLVQQLVDTLESSPEELQSFANSMAQYLTLEDSVAAKITNSYRTCVEDGIKGATEAIADNNGAMATATQEMADTLAEGMGAAGEAGGQAMAESLEASADEVGAAGEKVGNEAMDGVKGVLGENGENVGEIGEAADEALADAFESGKSKDAAITVSQEIYDNFASNLSEEQGYAIGEGFMGGMYDAVHTLGEQVIEAAAAMAEEAKRLLRDIPPAGGGGGNTPPGFAEGLDYVPYDNFLARLHEGERVLTKEENAQYMALMGDAKAPSFTAVQSRGGDMADGRAVVINNDIKVDGAQDPEAWTQTFIRTLKREARMA